MNTFFLPNLGYIKTKLPDELFESLREECMHVSDMTHTQFYTGLTKEGAPTHYWLRFSSESIKKYVMSLLDEYVKTFNHAIDMIFKSDGIANATYSPDNPWVNVQRHGEFIPNHDHYGFLSYNIWVNISSPCMFEFVYNGTTGVNLRNKIPLDRSYEGTIILFPSKLVHCTYPHFNKEENRISVAGNILLNR